MIALIDADSMIYKAGYGVEDAIDCAADRDWETPYLIVTGKHHT